MIQYTVKKGDSLSLIARRFGFARWEPIWTYNKRFAPEPRLRGSDPDKIPAGAVITIPRTRAQYDQVIESLRELLLSIPRDARAQAQAVDADRKAIDRYGKNVDLAAAVATASVGVAKVAVQATTTLGARYATYRIGKELLKPAQKVAEHFLPEGDVDKGTDKLAKGAKVVVSNVGGATQKQGIALFTGMPVNAAKFGKDFGKGVAKDLAKEAGVHKLKEAGWRAEDAKQFVSLLCAVIEKGANAVEAIQPSWLAQKYVQWTTGESVDDAHGAARRRIEESAKASQARVQQAIDRLKLERDALYPPSVAAAAPAPKLGAAR